MIARTGRSAQRGRSAGLAGAGLAGLAGVACVACCAVPLLVTAELIAGGGQLSASLGWLPGLAAALAGLAALVILLPRWVRVRRAKGSGCGGEAGCGGSAEVRDGSTSRSTLAS